MPVSIVMDNNAAALKLAALKSPRVDIATRQGKLSLAAWQARLPFPVVAVACTKGGMPRLGEKTFTATVTRYPENEETKPLI